MDTAASVEEETKTQKPRSLPVAAPDGFFMNYTAKRRGRLWTRTRGENRHCTDPLRLHIAIRLCSFRDFQLAASGNSPRLPHIPVYRERPQHRRSNPNAGDAGDNLKQVTRFSPLLTLRPETRRSVISSAICYLPWQGWHCQLRHNRGLLTRVSSHPQVELK